MWPVVFAIVDWTPAVEKKVQALVKAAVPERGHTPLVRDPLSLPA
jgi:hypothetical protein